MSQEYICCFTGHRKIRAEDTNILPNMLESNINKLIANGVYIFRSGGAVGFDIFAALKVIEVKKSLSSVKLELYLPCKNQTERWGFRDKNAYSYILQNADKIVYTAENYSNGCMFHRNRRLVEGSDFCIAYCRQTVGGTAYTLNYAVEQNVNIINLAQIIDKNQNKM